MAFVRKMLVSNSLVLGIGLGVGLGSVGCMEQASNSAGADTAAGPSTRAKTGSTLGISLRNDTHPGRTWPVGEASAAQTLEADQLLACASADALRSLQTGEIITCRIRHLDPGQPDDGVALVGIHNIEREISYALPNTDTSNARVSNPALMLVSSEVSIEPCDDTKDFTLCKPGYAKRAAELDLASCCCDKYGV